MDFNKYLVICDLKESPHREATHYNLKARPGVPHCVNARPAHIKDINRENKKANTVRTQIKDLKRSGKTNKEIAEHFQLREGTVKELLKKES